MQPPPTTTTVENCDIESLDYDPPESCLSYFCEYFKLHFNFLCFLLICCVVSSGFLSLFLCVNHDLSILYFFLMFFGGSVFFFGFCVLIIECIRFLMENGLTCAFCVSSHKNDYEPIESQ